MKKKIFGFLTAVLTLAAVGTAAYASGNSEIQKEDGAYAATVTFNGSNYLYLKPGPWNVDGAKFVAYAWGGSAGAKFVAGTECPNDKGVFRMQMPAGTYTSCIMLRKSTASLDWNNEWNRVGDITFSSSAINCITVTGWSNTSYSQGTFTETPTAEPTLTVESEATVFTTQTYTLNAKLENSTSTITYSSADTTIATVDNKGVITGVKVGTTTITVKAGTLSKTVAITVKNHLGIMGDLFLNTNSWEDANVAYTGYLFPHEDANGVGEGTTQFIPFEVVDGSNHIQKITIPTEFNIGAKLIIIRHPAGLEESKMWNGMYNQSQDITSSSISGANYIEADGFDVNGEKKWIENLEGVWVETSYLKIKFDKVLDYAKVETWASSIQTTCSQTSEDGMAMTSAKWKEIETSFNELSEAEQFLVKDAEASESGSELQHALATYYHLVTNRGFNDFADRVDDSLETNRISILNDNSAIIIVISFVACFAFAGLVIYRKRKHN